MSRTGGRILVDQLALHGADLAFGVPGESYIDVLDALRDSPIRYVTCRHEGGAANMAEAHGKLTGGPGICFVTRGPGATQASVGVHTAYQDGTPLLLLVGQVPREDAEREAFQEIDYRRMFGPLAKWVAQVDQVERIPELVARAFRVATSGRPGPVVLALPEDVLADVADVPDASPYAPAQAAPGTDELDARRATCSPRPSVRSRSSVASPGARLQGTLSRPGARRAGSRSPRRGAARTTSTTRPRCYAGHLGVGADPALRDRLRDADVLLVVGARLGDIETGGFATIVPPGVGRTLIHVHPDPDEIGRVYEPALGIVVLRAALRRGAPRGSSRSTRAGAAARWTQRTAPGARRSRRAPLPGAVEVTGVMSALRERLGPDAILTSGAGNFTVWAHRFYVFRRYRTQLAPLSGAMGYGLPAAIAAKLVHPDRDVVCLAGDGDFLMTAQELATARQAGAPVVVVVRRQRHVRDDSDAPGAALPGPRERHRSGEPGLRRPRARVRRVRRARRADGRRARGARPRARGGRPGRAPRAGRPRGADAAPDPLRDPRRGGRLGRAPRDRAP